MGISEHVRKLGWAMTEKEPPPLTWGALWKLYQPFARLHHRSWRNQDSWAQWILRHLEEVAIATMTILDVEAYRTKRMCEHTRFDRPPGAAQLNREIALMRSMAQWAVVRRLLPFNPIAGMRYLRERPRVVVPDESQMSRLIDAIENDEVRAFSLMLFDSGMRFNEARTLRMDQVDFDAGVVYLEEEQTKTETARMTILTDRVIAAIRAIAWPGKHFLFENRKRSAPFSRSYIYERWVEAADVAGVRAADGSRLRPHDCRRGFVVRMSRLTSDTITMSMSGHQSWSVYRRHYRRVQVRDIVEARSKLEAEIAASTRKPPQKSPVRETAATDEDPAKLGDK